MSTYVVERDPQNIPLLQVSSCSRKKLNGLNQNLEFLELSLLFTSNYQGESY